VIIIVFFAFIGFSPFMGSLTARSGSQRHG
jgi:hypothetical protein